MIGAAARRAATEEELARAPSRSLAHRRPRVIDARIDPDTYAETLPTIRG
jgi:thiamine pyrophosphate-dependent acetolactate synthase large subunit-like protein